MRTGTHESAATETTLSRALSDPFSTHALDLRAHKVTWQQSRSQLSSFPVPDPCLHTESRDSNSDVIGSGGAAGGDHRIAAAEFNNHALTERSRITGPAAFSRPHTSPHREGGTFLTATQIQVRMVRSCLFLV